MVDVWWGCCRICFSSPFCVSPRREESLHKRIRSYQIGEWLSEQGVPPCSGWGVFQPLGRSFSRFSHGVGLGYGGWVAVLGIDGSTHHCRWGDLGLAREELSLASPCPQRGLCCAQPVPAAERVAPLVPDPISVFPSLDEMIWLPYGLIFSHHPLRLHLYFIPLSPNPSCSQPQMLSVQLLPACERCV